MISSLQAQDQYILNKPQITNPINYMINQVDLPVSHLKNKKQNNKIFERSQSNTSNATSKNQSQTQASVNNDEQLYENKNSFSSKPQYLSQNSTGNEESKSIEQSIEDQPQMESYLSYQNDNKQLFIDSCFKNLNCFEEQLPMVDEVCEYIDMKYSEQEMDLIEPCERSLSEKQRIHLQDNTPPNYSSQNIIQKKIPSHQEYQEILLQFNPEYYQKNLSAFLAKFYICDFQQIQKYFKQQKSQITSSFLKKFYEVLIPFVDNQSAEYRGVPGRLCSKLQEKPQKSKQYLKHLSSVIAQAKFRENSTRNNSIKAVARLFDNDDSTQFIQYLAHMLEFGRDFIIGAQYNPNVIASIQNLYNKTRAILCKLEIQRIEDQQMQQQGYLIVSDDQNIQ